MKILNHKFYHLLFLLFLNLELFLLKSVMLIVPSIIIYKMNFINFLIIKFFIKIKFANIINIINNKEIIPELLQNECNAREIYNSVIYFLMNPDLIKNN